jgi:Uncharacterized protein conserved in bacteria (DUF2213)
MKFYTPVQLGPRSGRTPEGFLVFYGAVIARCGLQTYGPGETPIEVGPDGFVKIERLPEDVFRPETMESIQGKPLVDDHPEDDVSPDNFKELLKGVVINPRRGEGAFADDEVIADVIVYDPVLMEDIKSGKRQLSCGYDAKYKEIGPAHAKQYDIIVNHIAIVRNARCGARCSILDHAKYVKVHDSIDCGLIHDSMHGLGTCKPGCECDDCRTHKNKDRRVLGDRKPRSIHLHLYHDAFEESKHPRGGNAKNRGQFSKGSSNGSSTKKPGHGVVKKKHNRPMMAKEHHQVVHPDDVEFLKHVFDNPRTKHRWVGHLMNLVRAPQHILDQIITHETDKAVGVGRALWAYARGKHPSHEDLADLHEFGMDIATFALLGVFEGTSIEETLLKAASHIAVHQVALKYASRLGAAGWKLAQGNRGSTEPEGAHDAQTEELELIRQFIKDIAEAIEKVRV